MDETLKLLMYLFVAFGLLVYGCNIETFDVCIRYGIWIVSLSEFDSLKLLMYLFMAFGLLVYG